MSSSPRLGPETPTPGEVAETVDAAPDGGAAKDQPRRTAEFPTLDHPELTTVERRHYVIGEEIAKGGMGRIIEARDRRLGRIVAIKELLPKNRDATRRFEHEARITARLQHPAIIHVYEAGVWPGGEPFFAMPIVPGKSLDKAVAARKTLVERLGLVPNVIAAVDALAYAHSQGVIHRDLKPSNVLVGEFGETVVIDWGLAKDLSTPASDPSSLQMVSATATAPMKTLVMNPSLVTTGQTPSKVTPNETVAGQIVGTPAYMPPEQARGEPADQRSDVYSLGALLYHVLTGVAPYSGDSARGIVKQVLARPPKRLREREPAVPVDVVAIVEKAMARTPEARYADAGELAADLKRFQTGQLVAARRYTVGQRLVRWIAKNRALVAIAVVAIATLVVIGSISIRRIVAEKTTAERRRLALLAEQGRVHLLAGQSGPALVYLDAAARGGLSGGALEFMMHDAMRPFAAQLAVVPVGGAEVRALAFSTDGKHIATGDDQGTVRIWSATGASERQFDGHAKRVTTVAFDPSSTHLLTTSDDGTVRIWDFGTGDVRIIRDTDSAVIDAALSPDGSRLVTASADGTARIWDVATGAQVGATLDHGATPDAPLTVRSARFSADGTRIVTAVSDGTARVWDAATGAPGAILRGHRAQTPVNVAVFSPVDSTIAVTAGDDGTARLWNTTLGKPLLATPIRHRGPVTAVAFTRDGRSLVTASADGTAAVWALPAPFPLDGPHTTAVLVATLAGHDDAVVSVELGNDDTRIATASLDGKARLWDARTGEPLAVFEGHARMIKPLAFSPDGSRIVTGGKDGTIRLWDVGAAASEGTLPIRAAATQVGVSPDGATVVTGTANGQVVQWDATGNRIRELVGDGEDVVNLAFSPDGARVVAASSAGVVEVWDVATGVRRSSRNAGAVATFVGADVATADGTTIQIWDPGTTTPPPAPLDAGRPVVALAATTDGATLVSAADDSVEVWDLHQHRGRTFATASRNRAIALSRDGRYLATCGDGDIQQIWDLAARPETAIPIEGPAGAVAAVVFTPDGSRVITAGADRVISVWDRATGKLLGTRRGHAEPVTALAIGGDGATLWSSGDTTARAWDVDIDRRSAAERAAFIRQRVPWRLGPDDRADRRTIEDMEGKH